MPFPVSNGAFSVSGGAFQTQTGGGGGPTVVDDFEHNDLATTYPHGAIDSSFATQSTATYEGSYALEFVASASGTDYIASVPSDGTLSNYPALGDTMTFYLYADSLTDYTAGIMRQITDSTYNERVSVWCFENEFWLVDRTDGSYTYASQQSLSMPLQEWCRVDFYVDSTTANAQIYDASETQLADTGSVTLKSTPTNDGVGFRSKAAPADTVYVDYLTL